MGNRIRFLLVRLLQADLGHLPQAGAIFRGRAVDIGVPSVGP
jgi:hypothetical protein